MSKRDAYVQKLHATIDEWNASIDLLKSKANQVNVDSKIEHQNQIEMLKRKRNEIEKKVAALTRSGEDAWEDLRSGADLAWEAMNEAIKTVTSRFR